MWRQRKLPKGPKTTIVSLLELGYLYRQWPDQLVSFFRFCKRAIKVENENGTSEELFMLPYMRKWGPQNPLWDKIDKHFMKHCPYSPCIAAIMQEGSWAELDVTKLHSDSRIVKIEGPMKFVLKPSDRNGMIDFEEMVNFDYGFLVYFKKDWTGLYYKTENNYVRMKVEEGNPIGYAFTFLHWESIEVLDMVLNSIKRAASKCYNGTNKAACNDKFTADLWKIIEAFGLKNFEVSRQKKKNINALYRRHHTDQHKGYYLLANSPVNREQYKDFHSHKAIATYQRRVFGFRRTGLLAASKRKKALRIRKKRKPHNRIQKGRFLQKIMDHIREVLADKDQRTELENLRQIIRQ